MVAPGQTPETTTSSGGNKPFRPQTSSMGTQSPQSNDGFDLARLSPQQVAAELARRSHARRFVDDPSGDMATREATESGNHPAETGADKATSGEKPASEAAPFDRLSQALSPTAEERRRLKQQYIEERYRWEEEQDRRETQRLHDAQTLPPESLAEQAVPKRAPLEQKLPEERDGPAFAADSRFAADRRFAARNDLPEEESRGTAMDAMTGDRAAFDQPSVRASAVKAAATETPPIDETLRGARREPRLTAIKAEELRTVLRAPDDVRGLITTSFDRRAQPGGEALRGPVSQHGHRHGALFLLVALAIGATLYFHPWTSGENEAARSDLSLNTAAGNSGTSGAATGPAVVNPIGASTEQAAPARSAPAKPASSAPAAARPTDPSPAVEMTPLSAQSATAPSVAPQPVPSQAVPEQSAAAPVTGSAAAPSADKAPASTAQSGDNRGKNVAAGATAPDDAAGKTAATGADTVAAAPQAMQPPVGPKQSFAPADTTATRQKITLPLPADAKAPALAPTMAQPVRPASSKSQGENGRSSLDVKPSPAWLHVQPYSGAGAPASDGTPLDTGANTPDAWMKPQPYREPGVLTPPN